MLDSQSKLDIIRQSMAGQLDVPAYEAINKEEAQTEEAVQGQEETQQQAPIAPEPAPVAPPAAQTIPNTPVHKQEFVSPSTSGVGLNQMKGSSRSNMVHPGKYENGGPVKKPKKPTTKKGITELQELLVSEGYSVGDKGVDGLWGTQTEDSYAAYTQQTSSDDIGTIDGVLGNIGRVTGDVSQSAQSYLQYMGNAMLQHYGFVKDDESFFDVDSNDLRTDELAMYKSILRDNLDKGKKGKVDYRDYSTKDDVKNAATSGAALRVLKSRGAHNTIKDDLFSTDNNKTREALYALTGNANYTIDDKGNVHLVDNYDFNPSQRNVKETGASVSKVWNEVTKGAYDNPWQNLHAAADHIKTRLPVNINLGSYKDLGLSPEEIKSLKAYTPHGTKKVDMVDMAKNKIMSYFETGGIKKKYSHGGSLKKKKEKARAIREGKGVRENDNGTHSTHLMESDIIGNPTNEYHVWPSIYPDAKNEYSEQTQSQAWERGEEFTFKSKRRASRFAAGSWKQGIDKREAMKAWRKAKRSKK